MVGSHNSGRKKHVRKLDYQIGSNEALLYFNYHKMQINQWITTSGIPRLGGAQLVFTHCFNRIFDCSIRVSQIFYNKAFARALPLKVSGTHAPQGSTVASQSLGDLQPSKSGLVYFW